MTSEHTAIKAGYEINGMTPSEIAEDRGLDLIAVKSALMQCSSKYRKDCGAEPADEDDLNFTNDELREVNKIIFETAISAETSEGEIDWKTRLAAAIYVRDDKKGRKEVMRQMQGNTFNILDFNVQVQQARAMKDRMLNKLIEA